MAGKLAFLYQNGRMIW